MPEPTLSDLPHPPAGCPANPFAGDFAPLIDAALHDLRNSLSAIRLGVELIGRRAHAHELDGVLGHVDNAALRAHAHSEALADVCRLAAGQEIATARGCFSLHAVVRQTLDEVTPPLALCVFEHDRFGEGDCIGDAARIAQFLTLAVEELAVAAPSASVIVISEVVGECFRVAVLGDQARTAPAPADAPNGASAAALRRVRMRGIATAHRGHVAFDFEQAGRVAIEGRFLSAGHVAL